MEDFFVGLFEELGFEAFGEFLDEEVFFLMIELFLDIGGLLNIVINAPL